MSKRNWEIKIWEKYDLLYIRLSKICTKYSSIFDMIRPTTYIATEKDNTKIQRNKLLDR